MICSWKERIEQLTSDNSGASELLGYAFVFGAVIATVIVVLVASGPIIDDAQSREATLAAENNFIHLDGEVQEVGDGADIRDFQREFPAGEFRQLEATTITFSQSGVEQTVSTTPLDYETETGDRVIYDGGMIAMARTGDALDRSHIRYSRQNAMTDRNPVFEIPSIQHPEEVDGLSTTRSTGIGFEVTQPTPETTTDTTIFNTDDGDITVEVESNLVSGWEEYFEQHPIVDENAVERTSETEIEFEIESGDINGDKITVTSKEIELAFFTS